MMKNSLRPLFVDLRHADRRNIYGRNGTRAMGRFSDIIIAMRRV